MLKILVKLSESYNEEASKFVYETISLELEHSLVSLSKWEAKYEKPFLGLVDLTDEEMAYYIEAMILTPDIPDEIINKLSNSNIESINEYMGKKMTATWFVEPPNAPKSREKITSELIYYWMISYQIPFEAQYWNLNRLFTLIKVFNAKNSKQPKMSPREAAAKRRALNDQRRAQHGTNG